MKLYIMNTILVLEGTCDEMIQFVKKYQIEFDKTKNTSFKTDIAKPSNDIQIKRRPGRPRKNVEIEIPTQSNVVEWLKTKDVILKNVKKHGGWKCTNPRKDRKGNTYTFYINQNGAERAAEVQGIDKTHIYVIRPTAAAQNHEKYPKFYFIEQNYTNETARNARGQYTQLWNRNHNFKLPQDISSHLSAKRIYTKSTVKVAK